MNDHARQHTGQNTGDGGPRLTAAGAARREAMLGELQGAMSARRRLRGLGRGAAAVLLVAGAGAALLARAGMVAPWPTEPEPVAARGTTPLIKMVETDATAAVRLSAGPARQRLTRIIGDEELLALAAQAGTPSGLIRVEGEARLVAHVTAEDEHTAR